MGSSVGGGLRTAAQARHRADARRRTYTGLEIADECVIGYGLDYAERYRTFPFIGTLAPHAYTT